MQKLQNVYSKENNVSTKSRLQSLNFASRISITLGVLLLLISIIASSQILAFIGLSITFWGLLFYYIQPEDFIKKALIGPMLNPALLNLLNVIKELNYKGKAIYLPSKFFKNPDELKVYLPKSSRAQKSLPDADILLNQHDQFFLKDGKGILFTPLGSKLLELFEKRLGINFSQMDLTYVRQQLPKLFTEELEIAQSVEIEIEQSDKTSESNGKPYALIRVNLSNSIINENEFLHDPDLTTTYNQIGSPICSSIACVLTKTTGKPVILEDISSLEGSNLVFTYKIENLEYTKHDTEIRQLVAPVASIGIDLNFLSRLPIGLILMLFGVVDLLWVGWLTWYDIIEWGKDIGTIFLGSRTGEAISLGIGMTVFYYFIIGLILLLSGMFIFYNKRRKAAVIRIDSNFLSRLPIGLILMLFGVVDLLWVGWLTWYDIIEWGKDIGTIFLGSRTGEAISLGIGMTVFYYFIIGLILLLSGLIIKMKYRGRLT